MHHSSPASHRTLRLPQSSPGSQPKLHIPEDLAALLGSRGWSTFWSVAVLLLPAGKCIKHPSPFRPRRYTTGEPAGSQPPIRKRNLARKDFRTCLGSGSAGKIAPALGLTGEKVDWEKKPCRRTRPSASLEQGLVQREGWVQVELIGVEVGGMWLFFTNGPKWGAPPKLEF